MERFSPWHFIALWILISCPMIFFGVGEKKKAIIELASYCWHSTIKLLIFPKWAGNDRIACSLLHAWKRKKKTTELLNTFLFFVFSEQCWLWAAHMDKIFCTFWQFIIWKIWHNEKRQKQPTEHWLLQSVASEISIFFLFCLHRQLQIRSRKYAPRGMFVFCKRTLAWVGVNVLVQSVLAPFVACTAGSKLQVLQKIQ